MKSLQVLQMKQGFKSNPMDLVKLVMINNPDGVSLNFKNYFGITVNPAADIDSAIAQLQDVLAADPANADANLINALNAPIIEGTLNNVAKDYVIDQIDESQYKNLIFDPTGGTGLTQDEIDEIASGQSTSATTGTSGGSASFDWGGVIANNLPGVLAAFGIGPSQNQNAAPSPSGGYSMNINWTIIILTIVVLAIIGVIAARVSK